MPRRAERRLIKDLQINDVSSVDRGAGRGVRVLLMKRDDHNNENKMNAITKMLNDVSETNDQIKKLVAAQRKTNPKLNDSMAIDLVMTSPEGRALRKREKERLGIVC